MKAFLPGKKAEGDIKPDQRLLGIGRHVQLKWGSPSTGMQMRTLCCSRPQGRRCQALICGAPSRQSLFEVGVGGGRSLENTSSPW